MRRHVLAALIIGLIACGLVVGLELAGLLARPEAMVDGLFGETTKRVLGAIQYAVVALAAIGAAFLTLAAERRGRMGLIIAALGVEFVGVGWICSLYKVSFQPLPAMIAVVLGFLGALFYVWVTAYLAERRLRGARIEA